MTKFLLQDSAIGKGVLSNDAPPEGVVGRSVRLRWLSGGDVFGEKTLNWKTGTTVNKAWLYPWNVKGQVSAIQEISWEAQGVGVAQLTLEWDAGGKLAAEKQFIWGTQGSAIVNKTLFWNVGEIELFAEQDLEWTVQGKVFKNQQLSWNSQGSVNKTQQLRWPTGGKVQSNKQLLWNVVGMPSASKQLIWGLPQSVSKSVKLEWFTEFTDLDALAFWHKADSGVNGNPATLVKNWAPTGTTYDITSPGMPIGDSINNLPGFVFSGGQRFDFSSGAFDFSKSYPGNTMMFLVRLKTTAPSSRTMPIFQSVRGVKTAWIKLMASVYHSSGHGYIQITDGNGSGIASNVASNVWSDNGIYVLTFWFNYATGVKRIYLNKTLIASSGTYNSGTMSSVSPIAQLQGVNASGGSASVWSNLYGTLVEQLGWVKALDDEDLDYFIEYLMRRGGLFTPLSKTVEISWDVEANQVSNEIELRWDVEANQVSNEIELRWDVEANQVSNEIELRWDIESEEDIFTKNLQWWFKGDEGVTGTTNISAWENQAATGSDYNVAQGIGANQPAIGTYSVNGIPGITFDGINDTLQFSGNGLGFTNNKSGISLYFLIRHTNVTSANRGLWSTSDSIGTINRVVALTFPTNALGLADRGEGSGSYQFAASTNNVLTDGTVYVLSFIVNLTGDVQKAYINGTEVATAACDNGATFHNSNSAVMQFGAYETGNFYNGTIFEAMGYDVAHDDTTRGEIEAYLAARGGL